MDTLKFVLGFGFQYIHAYRQRFVLGLLLAACAAAVNGALPWSMKILGDRMEIMISQELSPTSEETSGEKPLVEKTTSDSNPDINFVTSVQQTGTSIYSGLLDNLDPWLPKQGRPLDIWQILGILLFLPGVALLRGFFNYTSGYCMKWASEHIVNDLRYDVMCKLNTLSFDFYNQKRTGDLLQRIKSDTKSFYNALNFGLADLVREPLSILFLLITLLLLDWQMTLIIILTAPLLIIPMTVLGKKARIAGKGVVRADIYQSNNILETFANLRVIKAYGLEKLMERRFLKANEQRFKENMRSNRAQLLVNPIVELVSAITFTGVILLVMSTDRSVGDLNGFLFGLAVIYNPIKKVGRINLMFQKARFGIERLQETLATESSVSDKPDAKEAVHFNQALAFKKVSFHYETEDPDNAEETYRHQVLDKLNLEIPKGHKVGIAGESGSGKTTLVNLLLRFHDPAVGTIELDGCDLRNITLKSLREQMAFVTQETVLFDGTVAENISMGLNGGMQKAAQLPRQQIVDAAKAAYAHDFIEALENGYDTAIGERGSRLSGGQRQRLAIARAFVRDAPILILDEATAALDSKAEAEVQKAIDKLTENRTVVCIAHRLATLRNMDEVLFLHCGKIHERGSFDELLEERGLFAAMAARQGYGVK